MYLYRSNLFLNSPSLLFIRLLIVSKSLGFILIEVLFFCSAAQFIISILSSNTRSLYTKTGTVPLGLISIICFGLSFREISNISKSIPHDNNAIRALIAYGHLRYENNKGFSCLTLSSCLT